MTECSRPRRSKQKKLLLLSELSQSGRTLEQLLHLFLVLKQARVTEVAVNFRRKLILAGSCLLISDMLDKMDGFANRPDLVMSSSL